VAQFCTAERSRGCKDQQLEVVNGGGLVTRWLYYKAGVAVGWQSTKSYDGSSLHSGQKG
jgi:hypothetical protein